MEFGYEQLDIIFCLIVGCIVVIESYNMIDRDFKYDFSVWIACGIGRTVRLAKEMGTTNNAISAMITDKNWNMSYEKQKQFRDAIAKVEDIEINNCKFVEGIILRSTKYSFHPDKWVSDIAKRQLKKFSAVYLSF
jgi:hypothetical protein